MAKVLVGDGFVEMPTVRLRRGIGDRVSKYPWHLWLDGRVWKITRGVDFECTVGTLRGLITNQASRHMKRVWTKRVDEDTILVQKVGIREF